MIVSKTATAIWNPANIKHYTQKGYIYTKVGNTFEVKVEDLHPVSKFLVSVKCDYCGKIVQKPYYLVSDSIHHTCGDEMCRRKAISQGHKNRNPQDKEESKKRQIMTFKSRYGKNENPEGAKELYERKRMAYKNKTGYDNPAQNPEVRNKMQNTYFKKTGYTNPWGNPDVVKKLVHKSLINRQKQGTIPTSKYQQHLCRLLNGELNFILDHLALDIALVDKKIDIEYNGGAHFYNVILGVETLQTAQNKDLRRRNYVQRLGWKTITINNTNENEPFLDTNIVQLINESIQYLNSTHHWVVIDMNNLRFYSSQFNYKLDKLGNKIN